MGDLMKVFKKGFTFCTGGREPVPAAKAIGTISLNDKLSATTTDSRHARAREQQLLELAAEAGRIAKEMEEQEDKEEEKAEKEEEALKPEDLTPEKIKQHFSLCRIILVFSGIATTNTGLVPIIAIAFPTDVAYYFPSAAASVVGLTVAGMNVVGLLGPKFGEIADRAGDYRTLTLLGVLLSFFGRLLMYYASMDRSVVGFSIYATGFIFGSAMGAFMQSTAFFAIAGAYGILRADVAGTISGILVFFINLGQLVGFSVFAVMQVSDTQHDLYLYAALIQLATIPSLVCLPKIVWQPQKVTAALYPEYVQPPDTEKDSNPCATTWTMLKAWMSPKYFAFLMILWNQIFFLMAQNVYGVAQMYLIEDYVAGKDGQAYFGTASSIATILGLAIALPAGKIVDKFGAMNSGQLTGYGGAIVFVLFPFLTSETLMTIGICANSIFYQIIQAAVIPLIAMTVPDQNNFARDMGGVMTAQGIGGVVATLYAGPWLDILTPAGGPKTYAGNERTKYSELSYQTLYGINGFCLFLSGACVLIAARHTKRAKSGGKAVLF